MNGNGFLVPIPIIISGFDLKKVFSRFDVCIIGCFSVTHIVPILIETFQFIGILVFTRLIITQCHEVKPKIILVML